MKSLTRKRYSELIKISSFSDRLEYLKLSGKVSDPTFGKDRYLNQILYHSKEWLSFRKQIIVRDDGCDLAHANYPLNRYVLIHHLNPLTIEDILTRSDSVFDPENVITTCLKTHNLIHYGNDVEFVKLDGDRQPGDTCLWR